MPTLLSKKPAAVAAAPLESYEPYAQAVAKMGELQAKRAEIDHRLDDLNCRLLNDKDLPPGNAADEGARLLLGGQQRETRASIREQARKLQAELDIVERACKLHQPTVDSTRAKAAFLVRQSLLPAHKAAGRAIAAAAEQLIEALTAEANIRDQLDGLHVEFGAPLQGIAMPCVGPADGAYAERFERLRYWLKENAAYVK